jgi:CHRD domain-containing protein
MGSGTRRGGTKVSRKALAAFALAIALTITLALVVGRAGASPSTYNLKASLVTEKSASDATKARGVLSAKLTVAGKHSSFLWALHFSGLSGSAQRVGIYYTNTKQLALIICSHCRSGSHGAYRGSYVTIKPFLNAILHRGTFVSIRTKLNPSGEVRGQLKATAG